MERFTYIDDLVNAVRLLIDTKPGSSEINKDAADFD